MTFNSSERGVSPLLRMLLEHCPTRPLGAWATLIPAFMLLSPFSQVPWFLTTLLLAFGLMSLHPARAMTASPPLRRKVAFWMRVVLATTIGLFAALLNPPTVANPQWYIHVEDSSPNRAVVAVKPAYFELTLDQAPAITLPDGTAFLPTSRPLLGGLLREYNPYETSQLQSRENVVHQVAHWAKDCCQQDLQPIADDEPLSRLLRNQQLDEASPLPLWLRLIWRTCVFLGLTLAFRTCLGSKSPSGGSLSMLLPVLRFVSKTAVVFLLLAAAIEGFLGGYTTLLMRVFERTLASAPLMSGVACSLVTALVVWFCYRRCLDNDLKC